METDKTTFNELKISFSHCDIKCQFPSDLLPFPVAMMQLNVSLCFDNDFLGWVEGEAAGCQTEQQQKTLKFNTARQFTKF